MGALFPLDSNAPCNRASRVCPRECGMRRRRITPIALVIVRERRIAQKKPVERARIVEQTETHIPDPPLSLSLFFLSLPPPTLFLSLRRDSLSSAKKMIFPTDGFSPLEFFEALRLVSR